MASPQKRCHKFVLTFATLCIVGHAAVTCGRTVSARNASKPSRALARPVPGTDNVIVHLWEWSWADVAIECETFLGPAGFAAVQVSPPQEDVRSNQWWSRYQPVSYKLTASRSGTEAEFSAMVATCNRAGVDVIVDAVMNHMTNAAPGAVGRAGTIIDTKCSYPGLFSCDDFHHYCDGGGCPACPNCNNCLVRGCGGGGGADNLRNCNLNSGGPDTGLADLATGRPAVRQKLADYVSHLRSLGVAGLRVDAAKHIPPGDVHAIMGMAANASDMYLNLEVMLSNGGDSCLNTQEFHDLGSIWEFKYATVFGDAFRNNDLSTIYYNIDSGSGWPDGSHLWAPGNRAVSFVTNHDQFSGGANVWVDSPFSPDAYLAANLLLLAHPYGQPALFSSVNTHAPGYPGAPIIEDDACRNDGTCLNQRVHQQQHGASQQQQPAGCMPLNCGPLGSSAAYICEHRWPAIAAMVAWRAVAGLSGFTQDGYQLFQGGQQLAFTRGHSSAATQGGDGAGSAPAGTHHTLGGGGASSRRNQGLSTVLAEHHIWHSSSSSSSGSSGSSSGSDTGSGNGASIDDTHGTSSSQHQKVINKRQRESIGNGGGGSSSSSSNDYPGLAFLLLNIAGGSSTSFDQEVDTKGMPPGSYCNIASGLDGCWPCTAQCASHVTVWDNGHAHIQLGRYQAVAFHIQSMVPHATSAAA